MGRLIYEVFMDEIMLHFIMKLYNCYEERALFSDLEQLGCCFMKKKRTQSVLQKKKTPWNWNKGFCDCGRLQIFWKGLIYPCCSQHNEAISPPSFISSVLEFQPAFQFTVETVIPLKAAL